jgi:hypothetical protein
VSLRVSYSIDGIGHVLDGVVAAALVAVADAADEYMVTPASGPTAVRSGVNLSVALSALAAALGVSR